MTRSVGMVATSRREDPLVVPAASGDSSFEAAAATIVHELKSPLTSLMGYARMLRTNWERVDADRRIEYFDVIERQGRRMLEMLESLLDSSRIAAGVPRTQREPIDLQSVIRACVQTAQGICTTHRISVSMPTADLGLFGDANSIEHVLTNLIENAVKHSPLGSAVSVGVQDCGSEVRVSVADDGPGIDADDIPHIFDRFRRGTGASSRGFGLGLYIVRSLVSAHGGQVWAESNSDGGSTFTFSLPRRTMTPSQP